MLNFENWQFVARGQLLIWELHFLPVAKTQSSVLC